MLAAEAAGHSGHLQDVEDLYRVTGGNSFFVTEVLAETDRSVVPATVRDAVLARPERLDPAAREAAQAHGPVADAIFQVQEGA